MRGFETEGPTGRIEGRVVSAAGTPILAATVMLSAARPTDVDTATLTDGGGCFSFGAVAPAEYCILVNASGFGTQQLLLHLEAGGVSRLVVVVGRG